MDENKHKETEFSNVKEVWKQNEKNKREGTEPNDQGSDFSSISDTWEQNERNESGEVAASAGKDKETLGNDYWDRVADDAASGYKTEKDEDEILNIDQLPDDHERDDKATE